MFQKPLPLSIKVEVSQMSGKLIAESRDYLCPHERLLQAYDSGYCPQDVLLGSILSQNGFACLDVASVVAVELKQVIV